MIELGRTPRLRGDPLQIGETPGIGGDIERLIGQNPARLVLPVSVSRRAGPDRDDHLGTVCADHRDDVPEDLLPRPMGERLIGALREAVVEGTREELASTVHITGRLEFPGANDAETLAQLGPDDVLTAVSPSEREIGRLDAHAPGECREKAGVLVIRVRTDHQDPLHTVELTKGEPDLDDATSLGSDLSRERRGRKQADHPHEGFACHRHGPNVPPTPN